MVRIDLTYEGELHCNATHTPSGTTLSTDAPVDNQGRGESFSPTDLLATSLGACMATIMGIAADKHDVDLAGMRVTVVKTMVADPERRVGKLQVVFHVPTDPGERMRTTLERAAAHCPVHKSLHPDVEIATLFRWGHA